MMTLGPCAHCGLPVEYDKCGIRWHRECAAAYDKRARKSVIALCVVMGMVAGVLLGIFGVLALGGGQ